MRKRASHSYLARLARICDVLGRPPFFCTPHMLAYIVVPRTLSPVAATRAVQIESAPHEKRLYFYSAQGQTTNLFQIIQFRLLIWGHRLSDPPWQQYTIDDINFLFIRISRAKHYNFIVSFPYNVSNTIFIVCSDALLN